MLRAMKDDAVDLGELDIGHLALFVGMAINDVVLADLTKQGFPALKSAHGFIVQHLLRRAHSVSELAKLLGVTQQAVSKTLKEMSAEGYVEDGESSDARVRMVALSERGHELVEASRAARRRLQNKLRKRLGEGELARVHQTLTQVLGLVGGAEAVQKRRVRPPI